VVVHPSSGWVYRHSRRFPITRSGTSCHEHLTPNTRCRSSSRRKVYPPRSWVRSLQEVSEAYTATPQPKSLSPSRRGELAVQDRHQCPGQAHRAPGRHSVPKSAQGAQVGTVCPGRHSAQVSAIGEINSAARFSPLIYLSRDTGRIPQEAKFFRQVGFFSPTLSPVTPKSPREAHDRGTVVKARFGQSVGTLLPRSFGSGPCA
jgi:hypothetical protein